MLGMSCHTYSYYMTPLYSRESIPRTLCCCVVAVLTSQLPGSSLLASCSADVAATGHTQCAHER